MTDVSRAGSRGSAVAISSHPPTWATSARASSQPWAGQAKAKLKSGSATPDRSAPIAALGTDAVPVLADAWWNAKDDAEAARVEAVLLAIGRDGVLRRLRRLQEGARGAEEKMLHALISVLSEEGTEEGGWLMHVDMSEREFHRLMKEEPGLQRCCLDTSCDTAV